MTGRVRASGAQPFSVRLTAAEKALLEAKAGRRPLGVFVREQLLGDGGVPREAASQTPRARDKALAQLLAMLGASELGGNLARMVRLAETGILPTDYATAEQLRHASAAVLEMRTLLLRALGRRVPDRQPQAGAQSDPLSGMFARAANKPEDRS